MENYERKNTPTYGILLKDILTNHWLKNSSKMRWSHLRYSFSVGQRNFFTEELGNNWHQQLPLKLTSTYWSAFSLSIVWAHQRTYKDRLAISTIYEVYHMFTWKGYPQDINWDEVEPKTLNAQGDRSRAILHAVGLRLDLKLRKQLYLTGTFMNYTRDTKYRYHANVFSNTSEGRIMLTYKY